MLVDSPFSFSVLGGEGGEVEDGAGGQFGEGVDGELSSKSSKRIMRK